MSLELAHYGWWDKKLLAQGLFGQDKVKPPVTRIARDLEFTLPSTDLKNGTHGALGVSTMKKWVQKLAEQLEIDVQADQAPATLKRSPKKKLAVAEDSFEPSEAQATLLYLLDAYSKNLMDFENFPLRKARAQFDQFSRDLLKTAERDTYFKVRQFFSSYRTAESAYLQKAFDDFKNIIWEFADQLSEDINFEQSQDARTMSALEQLKEAVDANSVDSLRSKSKEFIQFYVDYQSKKETRRDKRMQTVKKSLRSTQSKLDEAQVSLRSDHLTGAANRRTFEESLKQHHLVHQTTHSPVSMIILDIDHFKKVNDNYGHDVGDFVLKECVRLLKECFTRDNDVVARIGGEEFAIVLPDYQVKHAIQKAEETLEHIRKQIFVQDQYQIKFTVSMGIAQLQNKESIEQWIKRADTALYQSKNSGRNKFTVAPHLSLAAENAS
jgi:diguanylate cyclase